MRDHSKTCISLMACGNILGVFLPPYIVYKGMNVYDSWCTGGPKGAVYTSSPSGMVFYIENIYMALRWGRGLL